MKKNVYVDRIASKLNMTKKSVNQVCDAFVEELSNSLLEKDTVSITNFGTFKKHKTKPYTYFSPVDGSKMQTEGITKISFTMSKEFIKKINKE